MNKISSAVPEAVARRLAVAKGSLTGAGLGALHGGILGGAVGGNLASAGKGALAGGGMGAVAGGVAGDIYHTSGLKTLANAKKGLARQAALALGSDVGVGVVSGTIGAVGGAHVYKKHNEKDKVAVDLGTLMAVGRAAAMSPIGKTLLISKAGLTAGALGYAAGKTTHKEKK